MKKEIPNDILKLAGALVLRQVVTDLLTMPEEAYKSILDVPDGYQSNLKIPGALSSVKEQTQVLFDAREKLIAIGEKRLIEKAGTPTQ